MFCDTHCHLFKEYYEDINAVLKNATFNQVNRMINAGCDAKSNQEVLETLKYNEVYGALGIHPEDVLNYQEEDIKFMEENLKQEKVIAIGEIGLDYHYGKENREEQLKLFERQLALAEKYQMPVVVHSREATEDTIELLKKYNLKGVIHSFSGSLEVATIYIKMGFLLGINGVITFKNCHLKDVIKEIDVHNLVLETDSPYLTPVPYRGEKNEPSHILDIAEFVSQVKGIPLEELARITNENIKRTFDI